MLSDCTFIVVCGAAVIAFFETREALEVFLLAYKHSHPTWDLTVYEEIDL